MGAEGGPAPLFLLQGVRGSGHGRQQWRQHYTPERGFTVFHARGGARHRWHDHFGESERGEKVLVGGGGTAPVWAIHPQLAEPREHSGDWAGKMSTATCLSPSF